MNGQGLSPELVTKRVLEDVARRDFPTAMDVLVRAYGPELAGFCAVQLKDPPQAEEAFSEALFDIWRGLPQFRFSASVRTWAYAVTRHACFRVRQAEHRRRETTAERDDFWAQLEAPLRTLTQTWLRTTVRQEVVRLRESLDEEDQALLTLRLDRRLTWDEVAQVLAGPVALEPAELKKATAAARKRFERVKASIAVLAQAQGLLK